MSKNPNEEQREYVEAVPGPAFVVSKETYKRMKTSTTDKEKWDRISANAKKLNITHDKSEFDRNR